MNLIKLSILICISLLSYSGSCQNDRPQALTINNYKTFASTLTARLGDSLHLDSQTSDKVEKIFQDFSYSLITLQNDSSQFKRKSELIKKIASEEDDRLRAALTEEQYQKYLEIIARRKNKEH